MMADVRTYIMLQNRDDIEIIDTIEELIGAKLSKLANLWSICLTH